VLRQRLFERRQPAHEVGLGGIGLDLAGGDELGVAGGESVGHEPGGRIAGRAARGGMDCYVEPGRK